MLKEQATATSPTSATDPRPVVTIDRIDDRHNTLFPKPLPPAALYAVAIYRNGVLDDIVTIGLGYDLGDVEGLRRIAQDAARMHGYRYNPGCDYCRINCPPGARGEHERMNRTSETAHWVRWAA